MNILLNYKNWQSKMKLLYTMNFRVEFYKWWDTDLILSTACLISSSEFSP